MFDEYFNPPSSVVSPVPVATAPRAVDIVGSPSSTTIDQDAPSSSTSSTNQQQQSSIISQGVEEPIPNALFDDPCHEPLHDVSTSQESSSNVQSSHSSLELIETDAMWFYFDAFLTSVKPKNFKEAMLESSWIEAMQEEIQEFERLQVWELVDLQDGCQNGFLKWRAQGRFLRFSTKRIFYQDNPSHVYKLKKALYGLKQAPRAWYDMLSSFLISQHFSKGAVDPTLFTRKAGNDLLLVQIYVDDIIFASTNTAMCDEFANLMTTKFKMSMMGQMSFFLGLQISQSPRGIFINQSKYASEIIKKYGMLTSDSVDTPMVEKNKLDADLQGTPVDATHYRGMIGSLMYLTSSRPDLIYAVCLCARYQAKPTEKHLNAVKRIFRYLKGTINMGLWYSKDTDYGFTFNKIPLYCDNKSVISLCCNNVQHSRAKHIDVRYHFIKDQVENGIVELYFIQTEYQLANIFTKPLPRERFNFLIVKLGMRSMSPETLQRLTEEEDE
ncbi:retrovirus-related pol polyprotein from transposon TNT 1-94 [Tanacetum coccineum]